MRTLLATPNISVSLRIPRRIWRNNKGWLFVAPAVILWIFVALYPVVTSIALAFVRWNGFTGFSVFPNYVCQAPTCTYVGFQNFARFLNPSSPAFDTFISALGNNFIFMGLGTSGVIALALPLALALDRARRGIKILRTLLLLPMVTAGIAVYYVWSFIYQANGPLNGMLQVLGLGDFVAKNGWLGDIHTALLSLVVITIWAAVPFAMLLYLAGLQTIPQEIIEAAIVDGAGGWTRLSKIIWPLLKPITIIVIITSLSGALQGYELPLLVTDGGPTNHTNVVGLIIFKTAFAGFGTPDLGLASAYGWALFILGLGFSIFALRSMRTLD